MRGERKKNYDRAFETATVAFCVGCMVLLALIALFLRN